MLHSKTQGMLEAFPAHTEGGLPVWFLQGILAVVECCRWAWVEIPGSWALFSTWKNLVGFLFD